MGQDGTKKASGFLVVVLALLTGFGPLSTDMYLPALPTIRADLATDLAGVQLTLSAYLVGFAVAQLLYGPLSDRFGRKPAVLIGVSIFAAASIACAMAPSIEVLVVCRVLQAVGACAGPVLGRAIVRDLFEPQEAAKLLSILAMAMGLAPALGPIAGAALLEVAGWRTIFLALAVFGGAMLIAVTAIPETNTRRDPRATDVRRFSANVAELARHSVFVGNVLAISGCYAGLFCFISLSSHTMIDGFGIDPDQFALMFATIVVGYSFGAFLSSRITQRVGMDRMVTLGLAANSIAGAAMWVFALIDAGPWAQVFAMAGFMIGCGVLLPNVMASAVGPFPHMAGTASAVLGFTQCCLAALVGLGVASIADTKGVVMAGAIAMLSVLALTVRSAILAGSPVGRLEQLRR